MPTETFWMPSDSWNSATNTSSCDVSRIVSALVVKSVGIHCRSEMKASAAKAFHASTRW